MSQELRIAFATMDGETITRHFGRARSYEVVILRDGAVVDRTNRIAPPHSHGHGEGGRHDHSGLLEVLADCDVVVAGGMGPPMRADFRARGIRPILTSETSIDEAVRRLAAGELQDESGELGRHGHRHHDH
jgi:predicted Fe-Mo cluster-binding NifX family protein